MYGQPARVISQRVSRLLVAGLLVVSAAIGAALGYELKASFSAAAAPFDVLGSDPHGAAPSAVPGLAYVGGLRDRGLSLIRGLASPPDPHRSHQPPGRPPRAAAPGSPGAAIPARPAAAAPDSPEATAPRVPGAVAPGGAVPREAPRPGRSGEADGVVPDGTTVFDGEIPGVARLNPALLSALRRAATAARNDGVTIYVTSGWRSPTYQEQLLHEAISQYGSAQEAARWVGTPTASAHVSGDAVDVGPADATAWLAKYGAAYGLCRIYGNEPWHYELRTDAIGHGCPSVYADPTRDPRMQQ